MKFDEVRLKIDKPLKPKIYFKKSHIKIKYCNYSKFWKNPSDTRLFKNEHFIKKQLVKSHFNLSKGNEHKKGYY